MSFYAPEPPLYLVQISRERWSKKWKKEKEVLRAKLNGFFEPSADVKKLHRGVGIKYEFDRGLETHSLRGVIFRRRQSEITIICFNWPGMRPIHMLQIGYQRKDWQEYQKALAKRRLEKFEAQIRKKKRLREFAEKIKDRQKDWRWSETSFGALVSDYMRVHQLSEKEAEIARQYIHLLNQANPINFSR